MKHFLAGLGLGIAGIALALGLTLGALAVAGPHVGEPPTPPSITLPREPSPTVSPSPEDRRENPGGREDRGDGERDGKATPTPTVSDDRPSPTPSVEDDRSGPGGGGSDDGRSDDDSGHEGEPDDD